MDVCGPGALVDQPEEHGRLLEMRRNFRFLSRLPESPPRFLKEALKSGGDSKRLMLDRENYYAMTGGHGACRGCGEVTAIRLITSANRAMRHQRYLEHARELESLTEKLRHKMGELVASKDQESRLERVKRTLMVLDAVFTTSKADQPAMDRHPRYSPMPQVAAAFTGRLFLSIPTPIPG